LGFGVLLSWQNEETSRGTVIEEPGTMSLLENQPKNASLLRELSSLEVALSEDSPKNAFATARSWQDSPISFLDFVSGVLLDESNSKAGRHAPSFSSPAFELEPTATPDFTSRVPQLDCDIKNLISQAKLCCTAPTSPIVAVLGLLNAGKSSLVATYLSDDNRRRILVGSSNSQGTHRFVLWVPESWKQEPVIWDFISQRLFSVFGCESETLSLNPEEAAAQYNDTCPREYRDPAGNLQLRPTIEIPLIATDRELDRWGLAIMDCPDVQTGLMPDSTTGSMDLRPWESSHPDELFHERSQSIADARLNVLALAAPLCSAFVVVLPANAMHDQTVSRLMRLLQQRMSSVHQFVAVNRVPRKYAAAEIQQELKKLYSHLPIDRQYMAYSFDGPIQRERIPSPPKGYREPDNPTLPLFFRIDQPPVPQPPNPIAEAAWLLNIGPQLDKHSLLKDVLESTVSQLRSRVEQAIAMSEVRSRESREATVELQNTVANACLDFSLESSSPSKEPRVRLQASRQIVQQISKSLERTAPWWAMPGRWTTRIAEASKESLARSTRWIQLPTWFSGKTESIGRWIFSRWTSGQAGKIVTADALVGYLQRHDARGHLNLDAAGSWNASADSQPLRVKAACQRSIERFQNESRIELDEKELDEFTAKMWSEMPLSKRLLTGFAPAGILFAPLIAVLMVPLDFGGSAVLVFASIKELLLAGVTGVGLVMASADSMPKIAESEAAWQQFGDLFAVLCDELGLQRPAQAYMPSIQFGQSHRRVPSSRIVSPISSNDSKTVNDRPTNPSAVPLEYNVNSATKAQIKSILGRLTQAC
jgi:hypothetical protein